MCRGPGTLEFVQHKIAHRTTVCLRKPLYAAGGAAHDSSSSNSSAPNTTSSSSSSAWQQEDQPPQLLRHPDSAGARFDNSSSSSTDGSSSGRGGGGAVSAATTMTPIAWVVEMEPPGMAGIAYTVESERQKGYGRTVLAALFLQLTAVQEAAAAAGEVEEDEIYVAGYVVNGNNASMAMMEGVGLQKTGVHNWVGYAKGEVGDPVVESGGWLQQQRQEQQRSNL